MSFSPYKLNVRGKKIMDYVEFKSLHKIIRLIRKFHGMSQAELANRIGTAATHLSSIENGRKEVTLRCLKRYSEAFNIPIFVIIFMCEAEVGDLSEALGNYVKLITSIKFELLEQNEI
jgi:transcriptional regulator with XRE-family HTH domain